MASPLHETATSLSAVTVQATSGNPVRTKPMLQSCSKCLKSRIVRLPITTPAWAPRTALFPAMRVAVFLTARPCAASGVWLGATGFGRMSQRLIPSCSATTSMATVSSCSGSPGAHLPPVPFRGSSTCSACYGKGTRI